MIGTDLAKQLDDLNTTKDTIDIIKMDVPTMMRIMELCSESKPSDVQLHELLTNMIKISKETDVITMKNYDNIWLGVISPSNSGVKKEQNESSISLRKALNIILDIK